jgi:Domain of unknown function (DUF1707)
MAAAGQPRPPRIEVTDADRDRHIGVLREHFARDVIDEVELDRRVGTVLAARWADEAAAAIADLPSLVTPGTSGKLRRKGHGQAARPEPGWIPTSERFRDPSSRVIMRVWLNPAAPPGEDRWYVPDQD